MFFGENRSTAVRTAAVFLAVLLCLTMMTGTALADRTPDPKAPDREYRNEDTGFLAAVYDATGQFSEEEKDRLMSVMERCTVRCDVFVITIGMSTDGIEEDPAIQKILCSWPYFALIFGSEPSDMKTLWAEDRETAAFPESELLECLQRAKEERENGASACSAAVQMMTDFVPFLESIEGERPIEQSGSFYFFRSLKELKSILGMESEEVIWASDLRNQDRTLTEDLTIPGGKQVFFGEGTITVEPGVTVTIEKDASLYFYGMDVKGTVVNNGNLYQTDMEENGFLPLRVTGKIVNRGWFFYGKIEGLDHVETGEGGRTFTETEETPVPTEVPHPSGREGFSRRLREIYIRFRIFLLRHRETIQNTVPGIVVLAIVWFLTSMKKKKKKKQGNNTDRKMPVTRSISAPPAKPAIDEEQKKRISRLDDWLKSGLIDKAEYKALKERYLKEGKTPKL